MYSGCQELAKHSNKEFEALFVLKIGSVKAKFSGQVTLDTRDAPDINFSESGRVMVASLSLPNVALILNRLPMVTTLCRTTRQRLKTVEN